MALDYVTTPATPPREQDTVIKYTKAEIIAMLKGAAINRTHMADIVNYIRLRPATFP